MQLEATPSGTSERTPLGVATKAVDDAARPEALRLLAYVHLRNIYHSTGAGRVARHLVEHLALRSDVQLKVLADARDYARVLPLVGEPWTQFEYRCFLRDTSRQQAIWYATGRPMAQQFWPEAEVVFCTAESYVPPGRASLAVTAHDAAYFEASAHRRDRAFWTQRLRWQMLFRRLSRRADLIHTVSEFSRERLSHFFPSLASRICVVPNGVTPYFFEPITDEGTSFLAGQDLLERRFVLVPGGLHFRKNADLVLAAAPKLLERHPDLLLCIVNHSDPSYGARAAAMPRVRMLGFVSDAALRALYGRARAVWFPSRYEGFGMPVLEAMASGAPVVASDASSLPEIAGGAALLAKPDSPGDHLDRLEALLEDSGLREAQVERGLQRASHFTWKRSANELYHLLAGLR